MKLVKKKLIKNMKIANMTMKKKKWKKKRYYLLKSEVSYTNNNDNQNAKKENFT